MSIRVIGMRDQVRPGEVEVNTTSRAVDPWRGLSPFLVGPCGLYDELVARNAENAWQFSKVYSGHVDDHGNPTEEYWRWARAGWADGWAHRYPMGRGARPLYSLWKGEQMGYVEARKRIYVPLYAEAVSGTQAWPKLLRLSRRSSVALRDFDGYDHAALGMSLSDVLNCEARKMGHAFVLAMMLVADLEALDQCRMRPA